MPTQGDILGFTNIWYQPGFENPVIQTLGEEQIKIFSPAYFIASKLEAFKGRGNNDGRTSKDFEDIVFVLQNRSKIWKEITESESEVKDYLIRTFTELMKNPNIEEWAKVLIKEMTSETINRERIENFIKENLATASINSITDHL